MHKRVALLLAAVAVLMILVPLSVVAAPQVYNLAAGDTLTVKCDTTLSGTISGREAKLTCAPAAAPTPTPRPGSAPAPTGACGESMDVWHPPVVNGCSTGHEHGDAPPAWLTSAGIHPTFHDRFNTSAAENTTKHTSMKGFATTFKGVDVYFRLHFASNPMERSARWHSYEVYARDPSGNISHWVGWTNSGDPNTDRIPRTQGDPGRRPIILAVDRASYDRGIRCEQWYSSPGSPQWGWDFGWTICNSTTLYGGPSENADPFNQATWVRSPDGSLGGTRRLEAAWYGNRPHPTGRFYATQFGQIVSGPNDARCSATTTSFGVTYNNICLEQNIASTLPTVAFPDNAVQRSFNTSGVRLPN